jgi:hypothetical protein
MELMHPYERLPLFTMGIVLAVCLIASHGLMLVRPQQAQAFLKKFPRDAFLGQVLLGIGLAWFWLLIAPPGLGKLSALAMDLGEFNTFKSILRLVVPASLILVTMSVRDFLAVRALGLCGLMAASPLLEAAFLKAPESRLLVPIYAYVMLTASLFFVGMPYLFRDAVQWVTAQSSRFTMFAAAGLLYGVGVLVCALAFWRGY